MEVATIVVDSGAYSTRAGYGGELEPQCIIPTVIGRQKTNSNEKLHTSSSKDLFIGSEVFDQSKIINLKCPITDRVITSMDEMQSVWSYIFTKELNINTEVSPVLLTESPQNPKAIREKTTEIFMESFKVPAFYMAYPGVLSLYASGMFNGLVIDAGETITQVLPVFQCWGLSHLTGRLDVGGRSLNAYLKKLLTDRGVSLVQNSETIRDIKEKMCYVAKNYQVEMNKNDVHDESTIYTLPDDTQISVGSQRFTCPELFFKPSNFGISGGGLTEIIENVLSKVDSDILPLITSNVVLSGGSSMFDNFADRVQSEMQDSLNPALKINVTAPPNRKHSAWIGGSILVSLSTFSQMWITQEEYNEIGPEIINLKCY